MEEAERKTRGGKGCMCLSRSQRVGCVWQVGLEREEGEQEPERVAKTTNAEFRGFGLFPADDSERDSRSIFVHGSDIKSVALWEKRAVCCLVWVG